MVKRAFIIFFLFLGCAPMVVKIDPTTFIVDTGPKENIPPVCRSAYESVTPKVAVANFTNNTTFEYARVVQENVRGASQRTAVGGAAAGVAPGAAGIVWGVKERAQFERESQRIEREFNAKLSESVEDGITDEIVNMGGAKVYTRSEMKKVLEEHKFQASGLVDESTLVQLGRIAGVRYIITGSVNNVDLKWVTLEEARAAAKDIFGKVGMVMAAGMEAQEGWNINAEISIRIIDVETGEILFSKIVRGRHVIGKMAYPNFDAMIGGIKKAASNAIADARPELSKWFTVKGYILQTRTSPDGRQRAALVSIGEKHGLKPNSELIVYTFQEIQDPFTGKPSCDTVRLPVRLIVTEQLQADKAWTIIEGNPDQVKRVRMGQLVERAPLRGKGFFQTIGH
ncbi:MAG: CsgG/HfaB family protein [Thermodesulfovibrionales bacterium]|nr:CsgG/HfaB family protein [Thermodesulfovibrionales bacterium]